MAKKDKNPSNYICLLSVHGLIRGHDLELGRDADTGGQTKYVVELARALAQQNDASRVDLITRLIDDGSIDAAYARPRETLDSNASIIRVEAGPAGYIAKEMLWEYLDTFADNVIEYLRGQVRLPDILHSHYADAGYVGSRVAHVLGIPLI
ncbi:MAG: glycosyltransferase, partial [Gammaproteobacteria bacterium]